MLELLNHNNNRVQFGHEKQYYYLLKVGQQMTITETPAGTFPKLTPSMLR